MLTHPLVPMGPIPTVLDPEGIYPYESFAETSQRPVLKRYRVVRLENDWLRVTVCPDLGGRVWSLEHRRPHRDVLFVPGSIQPVRILPRLGFIPGGIEVSFPIAHTPVQLEPVACEAERVNDRLYVWCGERELRYGMQWTVEYSLGAADRCVTQRTYFHNPNREARPWMSWSNAAVPARPDTEFHFPNGPVLRHGATLQTIDWQKDGPRRVSDVQRMTGYFWPRADAGACGAFTPSLGHGLYHVADPTLAPGMKLWTYGVGVHEVWARAASVSGEMYLEIQGGPHRDQSIKELLQPGEGRAHVEFWVPAAEPQDIHALACPRPELLSLERVPRFDWPPREAVGHWRCVERAWQTRQAARLPLLPDYSQNCWAPGGMAELGEALAWAVSVTTDEAREEWRFQHGAWLAARGQIDAALEVLHPSKDDRARALAGRLYLRAKRDPRAATEALRAIECEAFALHPQIMIERDLALAELGLDALPEREAWFARVANCQDEWLLERQAALLIDAGRLAEAKELLERTRFQLVHQRYCRTQLWKKIKAGLRLQQEDPPNWLGEDDLATFGAYRADDGPDARQ